MAKILTNDTNTTPQAGGSICALKTIKLEVTADELVMDAVFDLGPPPKGDFNYLGLTMSGDVDGSVGIRAHIGTAGTAVDYYIFSQFLTSATVGIQGGRGTGFEFPQENILMTISAAPTVAKDGIITITLLGWS